jgi:hypothetical protein
VQDWNNILTQVSCKQIKLYVAHGLIEEFASISLRCEKISGRAKPDKE